MRILAISGSLRAKSLNTEFLRFAARVAPHGTIVALSDGLDRLPHFNPDLDTCPGPVAVTAFREQLNSAAAQAAEFCSGCGDMQSRIRARRSWYAQECVGLGSRQRGIG